MFSAKQHSEKKWHDKSELDEGVNEEPVVERQVKVVEANVLTGRGCFERKDEIGGGER